MEVTAENFRQTLPQVLNAINLADFVAVDGEFSGLRRADPQQAFSKMDTVVERYCKVAASVREFGLLQFGLSCFHFNATTLAYETATFSFYLLKKMAPIDEPNIFTVSSDSLRFLASNNFDFNKLFKEGLSYLNQQESLELKAKLPKQIATRLGTNTEKPVLLDACKLLYNDVVKYIKKESMSVAAQVTPPKNSSNGSGPSSFSSDGVVLGPHFRPEHLVNFPTSQLHSPAGYTPPRHTVHQFSLKVLKRNLWKSLRTYVASTFSNVDADINDDQSSLEIKVFACRQDRDMFVYYSIIDDFYDTVGFSHVLAHLLMTGKPMVGHTCILDVLHVADKCLESLPNSLGAFKELYNANFSMLYDTKLIARNAPFAHKLESTSLEGVFSTTVNSKFCPRVSALPGCRSYAVKADAQEHDAGYDAFMTGVAFVGMVRWMDGARNRNKSVIHSNQLKPYENRTFMMQICDMDILHLAGEDDVVDRRGVFVVTSTKEVRYPLIKTLFPSLTSPMILSDNSEGTLHYVLSANETDKRRASQLLAEAQRLSPLEVTITLYSPKPLENGEEVMEASRHYLAKASKNVPAPLIQMYVANSNTTADNGQLPPLTPRTALLATTSTLDAKSPEFRPSLASAVACPSPLALYTSPRDQDLISPRTLPPSGLTAAPPACAGQKEPARLFQAATSFGTPARNPSATANQEEMDSSDDDDDSIMEGNPAEPVESQNVDLENDMTVEVLSNEVVRRSRRASRNTNQPSVRHKRGEKRKSGQFARAHLKSGKPLAAAAERDVASVPNAAAADAEGWNVSRNRNKYRQWKANTGTVSDKNRFPATTEEAGGGDWMVGKGRGKRSCGADGGGEAGGGGAGGDAAAVAVTLAPQEAASPHKRELKRLKSVGTDQLSNLSLNSPTSTQEFAVPPDAGSILSATSFSAQSICGDTSSVVSSSHSVSSARAEVSDPPGQQQLGKSKRLRSRSRHQEPGTTDELGTTGNFVVPDEW